MICKRCGGDIDTRRRLSDGSLQCPHCKVVYRPKPTQGYSSKPQQNKSTPPRRPVQVNYRGSRSRHRAQKKLRIVLLSGLALIILLIIIICVSCGSNNDKTAQNYIESSKLDTVANGNSIIGLWKDVAGTSFMLQFHENGTCGACIPVSTDQGEESTISVTEWKIDGNKLTIFDDVTYEYKIDKDTLIWGGFTLTRTDSSESELTSDNAASTTPIVSNSIFPLTAYDNNNVRIVLTGFNADGIMGDEIKYTFENNSSIPIMFGVGEAYIDGWKITTIGGDTLPAGTKTNGSITLSEIEMEECGINDIKSITLKECNIWNDDTFDIIESFDITLNLK